MKESRAQLLVTGTYRSGSEYLSNLIGLNKEISSSMYRVNAYRFGKNYETDQCHKNARCYLTETDERLTERYGMSLDIDEILGAAGGNLRLSNLYNCIMNSLYIKEGKSIWAEKNQLVWRDLERFTNEMPNGKGVLLIRDPRSVLVSFKKYTIAEDPLYLEAIFNCLDAMRLGMEWKEHDSKDIIVVKYEDLATDPKRIYRKICSLVGARETNISSEEIRLANFKDAYGKTWNSNSSFEGNQKAFDVAAAIDRWKDRISIEDLQLCEMVCGEYMEAFGYDKKVARIDENKCYERTRTSKVINEHMVKWLETGEGIQKFPLNPLDKKTWEK